MDTTWTVRNVDSTCTIADQRSIIILTEHQMHYIIPHIALMWLLIRWWGVYFVMVGWDHWCGTHEFCSFTLVILWKFMLESGVTQESKRLCLELLKITAISVSLHLISGFPLLATTDPHLSTYYHKCMRACHRAVLLLLHQWVSFIIPTRHYPVGERWALSKDSTLYGVL